MNPQLIAVYDTQVPSKRCPNGIVPTSNTQERGNYAVANQAFGKENGIYEEASGAMLESSLFSYDIVTNNIAPTWHLDTNTLILVSNSLKPTVRDQFDDDKLMFQTIRPSLMMDETYRNNYVALINGKVVDHDESEIDLVARGIKQHGYRPMYIGKVTNKEKVVTLPGPVL